MKTIVVIIVIASVFISSCSSWQCVAKAGNGFNSVCVKMAYKNSKPPTKEEK